MNILALLFYAGFIAYVSLRPTVGVPIGDWDKTGHLLAYFVFALLGYRVVPSPRHYLYLCLGIVIYGGLIEVAQSFTPNRTMSIYDLVANTVGVAFAMIIVRTLFNSKELN